MKLMELSVLCVRGGVVTKIRISCLFVFFGAGFGKCQSWQASRWVANPKMISNNKHFSTHRISKPTSPLPLLQGNLRISELPIRPCSIVELVDKPDPIPLRWSFKRVSRSSFMSVMSDIWPILFGALLSCHVTWRFWWKTLHEFMSFFFILKVVAVKLNFLAFKNKTREEDGNWWIVSIRPCSGKSGVQV